MNKRTSGFDFTLMILVIIAAICGVIIIGSATKVNINGLSSNFSSQIIWLITGIFLMLVFAFWNYHNLTKFYIVIYILNITLLVLVLIIGYGDDNVKRWLFGLQPSEFAKIFMIIYLSKIIDKYNDKINSLYMLLIIIGTTLLVFALINMQPSLSASLVIIAILITELFIGNISSKYIKIILLILIPIIVIIYIDIISQEHRILSLFIQPYQIKRIMTFISGDLSSPDMYQTKNSIWAIGSGKLHGKGLFNGTVNQLSYLPESHNDFIFSVIGEEFGFLGCLGNLLTLFLIISRCINIAIRAEDRLGTLLAGGVAGMLTFQTFINVGVVTGLLPNTGMPLPFFSYGGSSMWANMIGIGIVLNISMKKQKSIY